MRIALFKNIKYDFVSVAEFGLLDRSDEHVRVSEYIDIDFPSLPHDEVVTEQVNQLKQAKKNIQAETELKLTSIDAKIGELLALTHD